MYCLFKQAKECFKDFLQKVYFQKIYFFIATVAIFLSITFLNPIFLKFLFNNLNVSLFLKEHSLLTNTISLIGNLLFVSAIFFFYDSFFKDKDIVTKVKVFVAASILVNLFFSFLLIGLIVALFFLFVLLKINPIVTLFVITTIVSIFMFYILYVIPFIYGKSLNSNSIKDVFRNFLQSIKPKVFFGFLKDKKYFQISFECFFIFVIITIVILLLFIITYFLLSQTTNNILFIVYYLTNNFLIAFGYVFLTYSMVYLSIKIYDIYNKTKGEEIDK